MRPWPRHLLRYAALATVFVAAVAVLLVAVPRRSAPGSGARSLSSGPTAVTTEGESTAPSIFPASTVAASDSPTPIPVATPVATTQPTPRVSAAPSIAVDKHDRLWDPFVDFGPPLFLPYGLTSLRDATELADLIVTGSIGDLYIGEQWIVSKDEPTQPFAYLEVHIDEVLKGAPESRTENSVEVMFGLGYPKSAFVAASAEPMPTGTYLWFLIDESHQRDENGLPPRESDIAPFAYFIPNEVQGLVLNANGVAEVVLADRFEDIWGTARFPMTVRGESFESLIEQVREFASTTR